MYNRKELVETDLPVRHLRIKKLKKKNTLSTKGKKNNDFIRLHLEYFSQCDQGNLIQGNAQLLPSCLSRLQSCFQAI